jgi:hypothetical protein
MTDLTYMDCWHFIAPLIPISSETSQDIYVMVFQALKEADERKQFNILCGNAQLLECPQCGTLSVVDFAYCPGCGKDMHIPEDKRFKMSIDSNKCQYACVMQSYVPLTESVYLKPEDMPSLHDLVKEMYKYKEMYGM